MLLGCYALLILGTAFSTNKLTEEAFYVNNRASSAWGVGFSIIGSCI